LVENSSFIFLALEDVLGKNKCAVCAVAFLAQCLMACTISRITGNGSAMASRAGKETFRFRLVCEPELFVL